MWTHTWEKTFKNVSKEVIWKLWTDINHWPKWHDDLEYCQLHGQFEKGAYFTLKPKKMREVSIQITDVSPGVEFTDCTTFFGAKMYDTHSMLETENGLTIKNKMLVTGPLSWIWVKLVANYVANTIPDETEALITLARTYNE